MPLSEGFRTAPSLSLTFHAGSGAGEPAGGLIGAEEKVINSKNKVDEDMVSTGGWSPAHCPVRDLSVCMCL